MIDLGRFYGTDRLWKIPLTPLMQEDLGSLALYSSTVAKLRHVKHSPMPVRLGWRETCSQTQSMISRILSLTDKLACKELVSYENEMAHKCGPQGGPIPGASIYRCYEESYSLASRNVACHGLEDGLAYLLNSIIDFIDRVGYPQDVPNRSPGKEFSGLPICSSKNSLWSQGEIDWLRYTMPYFLPYPNVPGTRYQRLKDRTINMDSANNVDMVQSSLSKVRYWLRAYLPNFFGSWCNPAIYDAPAITSGMQKRFSWFGGDYRKMDEHFSRNIYSTWVRPVYKLLLSEEEFSTFDTFVYHLFSQPLYMGDYMWCGVHNLFSGQAITNDFETIYNIIEKITMLLLDGQQPHLCIVRALGDDSIVGVKRWYSDPISLNRQLAEANGLTLAEDKSYISNVPIYLRKVYDLSFPKYVGSDVVIGAYPAVLAWNSLRNPERPLSSLNENFVASLQICDNLVGHPLYANIASMFWKYWRGDITSEVSNVEITDWWSKLYGSNWSFRNSPTANLLMNRNQLTPEMLNIISNCT